MTEEQWLSCTDSLTMLGFLNGRGGRRRAQLFAAACCRSVERLLSDERSRRAIEAAESYAEGMIGEREGCGRSSIANHAAKPGVAVRRA